MCLVGAGAINAVLFLPLLLDLQPGGDGLAVDDSLAVVFLTTDAKAKRPETSMETPKPPQVDPPRFPSVILGDKVETIEAGPPTETPESVQQRLAETKRREQSDASKALECGAVVAIAADPSQPTATLALRVGVDGKVLEADIDRSSGIARIDKALLRCARAWGPFPVAIIDGRIVESWQTIRWPAWGAANQPPTG
jgi:protein TonB